MKNYDIAINKMQNSKNIAIFTHANADGDAIGSAFAFYFFLKGLGKNVDVFCKTTLPSQLKFLEVEELINKKTVTCAYDLAICVDCNTLEMTNIYAQDFLKCKSSISFDHHPNNPGFADINIVEPKLSSTCELIAKVFYETGCKITDRMAELLLTGIVTDSGGFKFSCTSKDTMNIVNRLLNENNIEISFIMSNVFESENEEYLEFYKEAINNTELIRNNTVAIISIQNSFFKRTGIDPNSAKNLTRIGTELKSVIVTALITEVEPNVCKVSFRSRLGYDCSKCASVFGGGGHKQASGCKIYGDFLTTKERVIKSITDGLV